MGGSVGICPSGTPPPTDLCKLLAQKIDELINRNKREFGGGTHGLKHRFPEQVYGANGPGTTSWDNHERTIRDQQKGLEKVLKNYEKNGCGPPPPGAWSYATRPVPAPAEWKGPKPVEGELVDAKTADALKAGAAAAGTVAAGYVIYRVIRFLPSLFPPLWPTIPANLAVP